MHSLPVLHTPFTSQGQPNGRKLGYDNIMNMCECVVKRIDGQWKIVEEWGLLGYSNFFQNAS